MLPPTPIRRLLLVPLIVLIAGAMAALAPPVALLSVAFNTLKRRARPGRPRRSRLLRVIILGLAWSTGEVAALTVYLCLWLVSGFGGRLDTEPYQARQYAIMRRFLDLVYRVAVRVCGLRLTVTGPRQTIPRSDRPLIVLSRHAGPGDSLLLIHHLLSVCERRPRVVMKATLQLDPTVDILANGLPNAFIHRAAHAGKVASSRQHTEQIRRLAAGMTTESALVIFPEGGNWTPGRWQRAITRLEQLGRRDLAARAKHMPNLLAPRGGGAFTAIAACPSADVIFVAHAGLDKLVSVADIWRQLPVDQTIKAKWWRVPVDEVPRDADHEAQLAWLYDWWGRIDAWISQNRPEPERPAPDPVAAPVQDG